MKEKIPKQKLCLLKNSSDGQIEVIENLLNSLENYKSLMEFKCKDFNSDRQAQYTAIEKKMCKKYEGFGPPRIIEVNDSEAEGDHSFSTYAKFSEKLLTPRYAYVRVHIRG